MLNDLSTAFLKRLLDTPGPSGFERGPARVWRDHARTFADVSSDVLGNSYAAAGGEPGAPTILLAGHIDEIGLIVTHVDAEGYVYVGAIGGWDPQVLVGQRVRFEGRDGPVLGVVGKKPIHLMKPDEREKASKLTDLWVDVGSANKAETLARLEVGDAGVLDTPLLELPNGRIVSRSIDNRVGAFVVLEALRRYAERPGAARVVAVATAQEEIGWRGGGARPSTVRVQPAMAVAVDVTFATDHPGVEKKEIGESTLGGGPVFTRGSVVSPVAYRLVREAAERLGVPFQMHAAGRESSTDADAIHNAAAGVATALISIPNRYMHSPNEMVALDDLDRTAEVIAEACRAVTAETDFTDR
ncbi:MAG TPA: M20/M25/M40 family metallo-hydrolase [Gemmatirosa sp.]